jgi:hypothetical protein
VNSHPLEAGHIQQQRQQALESPWARAEWTGRKTGRPLGAVGADLRSSWAVNGLVQTWLMPIVA